MRTPASLLLALGLSLSLAAQAHPLLDNYRAAAKAEDPAFKDFSAANGQKFYNAKTGELSCSSCHTDSPKALGKHAKTGKEIQPMAPVANAKRFTDAANVEKWFKRNCNDVLSRACSAQEKGDFIAYLLSVQ